MRQFDLLNMDTLQSSNLIDEGDHYVIEVDGQGILGGAHIARLRGRIDTVLSNSTTSIPRCMESPYCSAWTELASDAKIVGRPFLKPAGYRSETESLHPIHQIRRAGGDEENLRKALTRGRH